MPLKPGNAFAQQKEIQRQKELEEASNHDDQPGTPMTTMSMYTGPVSFESSSDEREKDLTSHASPQLLYHDHLKTITGKRSFTDPVSSTLTAASQTSNLSTGTKQHSGFSYLKSKFGGKNKKTRDGTAPAQIGTPNDDSQEQRQLPGDRKLVSTKNSIYFTPEQTPTAPRSTPSATTNPHLSKSTTQTVATPRSQYTTLSGNDGMILGNMALNPTQTGDYPVSGSPAMVNAHQSIMSMAGSIVNCTPRSSANLLIQQDELIKAAQSSTDESSYLAPLPLAPDEPTKQQQNDLQKEDQQLLPPHHYTPPGVGTWEQLHATNPGTMPQFSPINYQIEYDDGQSFEPRYTHSTDGSADTPRQASFALSSHHADSSNVQSEDHLVAAETEYDGSQGAVSRLAEKALRRTASDYDLTYTTYPSDLVISTPKATRIGYAVPLDASVPHSQPAKQTTSAAKHLSQLGKISNPVATFTQDARSANMKTALRFTHGQASKRGKFMQSNRGHGMPTRGGYSPTPPHPGYQARSNIEEQMTHQFNLVHHHLESDKHTIRRWLEDTKNHLADKLASHVPAGFLTQFNQLCLRSNALGQYLDRIQHHTSLLAPEIASKLTPAVKAEVENQIRAHDKGMREEFRVIENTVLTLNDNVNALQRNMSNHNKILDRKLDLLLREAGVEFVGLAGTIPTPEQMQAIQKKRREEAKESMRREDDRLNPAMMFEKERKLAAEHRNRQLDPAATFAKEAAATAVNREDARLDPVAQMEREKRAAATAAAARKPIAFGTAPPISPTKTRKPTPLPSASKAPVMAAHLTSTPPHVPQMPATRTISPSRTAEGRVVTIRDPTIPSPRAVCNAKRVGHGHKRTYKTKVEAQGEKGELHPSLRYNQGIESIAKAEEEKKEAEEQKKDDNSDNEVLWRKPSGVEIGDRWYKAAVSKADG